MKIVDLIRRDMVVPALQATDKRGILEELAHYMAGRHPRIDRTTLSRVLIEREQLASTAIGEGVAIPHGKLPKLEKIFGLFARLERPIDFEAMDGQPVDLVFLLLAPEGAGADHLKALARIARLLRDQDVAKKLRASREAQAIYSVLALPPASAA